MCARPAEIAGETQPSVAPPAAVLLVTNGHAEDHMGAALAAALRRGEPGCEIRAVPLVGPGEALRAAGVAVVGAEPILPSGGFIREGVRVLGRDLRHGLARQVWRLGRAVADCRRPGQVAVAVGDFVALLLARRARAERLVFLPTAKSVRSHRFFRAELWAMRRWCDPVHPRDGETDERMRQAGVPSAFLGNLLMDSLPPGRPVPEPVPGAVRLALLPGSRQEAARNLGLMLEVVVELDRQMRERRLVPDFRAALPGSLEASTAAAELSAQGWSVGEPQEAGWIARRDECEVAAHYGSFVEVASSSALVFGLAGAANEQAAGLGVPIVTMVGAGPQTSRRRLVEQQRLLLGATVLLEGSPADKARAVLALLSDEERRERLGGAGRRAMGAPGAVAAIAQQLLGGGPRAAED